MEDLVKDVRSIICDNGGERCHGVMVSHLLIVSTFPIFLFAEQHDLCDVLCRDLASG